MDHARDLSLALVDALDAQGINAFQNSGVAAGQSVPHYHMHLLPRRTADGNTFVSELDRALAPEADRFAMAERIQRALAALARR